MPSKRLYPNAQGHRERRHPPFWAWPGHLAVWPALYAAGALWLLDRVLGTPITNQTPDAGGRSALFVMLCAHAGYLLDRAKLSGGLLDAADRAANASRHGMISELGPAIRALIWVEIAAAGFIGYTVHPWLAAVPLGVATGVVCYAGRPARAGRPRPKDVRLLKSVFIATAHTALAAAVVLAVAGPGSILTPRAAAPIGSVWLIVLSDAVVCDLDDIEADRAFGTRSIPALLGEGVAWAIAWGSLAIGLLLMAASLGVRPSLAPSALLGATLVLAARLPRRKDFIDARLPAIALVCLLVA